MRQQSSDREQHVLRILSAALPLALVVLIAAVLIALASPDRLFSGSVTAEPWTAAQVVEPPVLVKQLADSGGAHPLVVCVGFDFLYQAAHVPGAVFYGPARESAGLDRLKAAAKDWPRDRDIVIYCGCCPFSHCPNVRPAFAALKQMGFTKLRVLHIENDFRADWLKPGYPIEKSLPATK